MCSIAAFMSWAIFFIATPVQAQQSFTVVIDPGHGGKDSGAVAETGELEKNVSLDISLRLASILQEQNVTVILTRDDDRFLKLSERTDMINRLNPDLCISVHANSSYITSVHGFESYIYHQRRKNGSILYSLQDIDTSIFSFPLNNLESNRYSKSLQLAYYLHGGMQRYTGASDRGIRAAHFYVLRKVSIPCVLVEVGFMSNHYENERLATGIYRENIAKALAEGIISAMYGEMPARLAAHHNEKNHAKQ